MSTRFIDTNIFIYAFSTDEKAVRARDLLTTPYHVSVQALNEFANVSRKRLGLDWLMIEKRIAMIRMFASGIHPITLETHLSALALAQKLKLSIYDSTMLASAVSAQCDIFYSEDMQHGLRIDGHMVIHNPFCDI